MAFTHVLTRAYRDSSGVNITSTEPVVDDTELNYDASFGIVTDHEIDWVATRANLQSLAIHVDKACTIKTNSSGSPVDTIALIAGQNLIWSLATDGLGKCPFTATVTKLFITTTINPTNIQIRGLAHQTV